MNEPINSPPPRNTAFYVGSAVAAVGLLLFLSVFFSAALNFGNFDNFEERGRSMALRAVIGMTMMIAGGAISSILTARRFGPQIESRFEDAARQLSSLSNPQPPQLIHCPYCNTDNDPLHKACQNCGAPLVQIRRCTACGQKAEPDDRFCSHCGKAIV